jgi:hypothetical protein
LLKFPDAIQMVSSPPPLGLVPSSGMSHHSIHSRLHELGRDETNNRRRDPEAHENNEAWEAIRHR